MNQKVYIDDLYGRSYAFKQTNFIPSNLPTLFVSDGTIPNTTAGNLYFTSGSNIQPLSSDKFSPKYLIGNILSGDSSVPYNGNGFIYIPDPGDCSGLNQALEQAVTNPGSIYLRGGIYDLSLGNVAVPMVVPNGTTITSGGNVTIISKGGSDDQAVFEIASNPSSSFGILPNGLENLSINTSSIASTGGISSSLITLKGNNMFLRNITCELKTTFNGVLRTAIEVTPDITVQLFPGIVFNNIGVLTLSPTTYGSVAGPTRPIVTNTVFISFNYVAIQGGDDGCTIGNGSIWDGQQLIVSDCLDYGVHTFGSSLNNPSALRARTITCLSDGNNSNVPIPISLWLEAGVTNIIEQIACVDIGGSKKGYGVSISGNSSVFTLQGILINHNTAIKTGSVSDGAFNCIFQGILIQDCTHMCDFYNSQLIYCNYNSVVTSDNGGEYASLFKIDNCINVNISDNKMQVLTDTNPSTLPFINITDSDLITINNNQISSTGIYGISSNSPNLYISSNLIDMIKDGVEFAIINKGSYGIIANNNIHGRTAAGCCLINSESFCKINNNILRNDDITSLTQSKCILLPSGYSTAVDNTCVVASDTSINASPAITVDGKYNICSGNICTLDSSHANSGIVVNGSNCNVINNICNTSVPVQDNGSGNQLGFNQ